MKKAILLLLIICTLSLTSCEGVLFEIGFRFNELITSLDFTPLPDKPEGTELEFWIGDRYADLDLSGHIEKYGMWGGRQYYGLGYVPTEVEGYGQKDPEHYVRYVFTGFPDHSDSMAVSYIEFNDPNINIWGLTVNSTDEEFTEVLEGLGFKVTDSGTFISAKRGRLDISLSASTHTMQIRYDVTNIHHLIF